MTQDKLNAILFQQIEKINNSKGEQLREELIKAKAIAEISRNIIENAKASLEAQKALSDTVDALPQYFDLKRDLDYREKRINRMISGNGK